jgi:hypothetical protein
MNFSAFSLFLQKLTFSAEMGPDGSVLTSGAEIDRDLLTISKVN